MQQHAVADKSHIKIGNSDHSVLSIDVLSLGVSVDDECRHLSIPSCESH